MKRHEIGLTYLELEIANPAKPKVSVKLEFLIDSGAIYSVVPETVLRKLKTRSIAKEEFHLADGGKIVRKKGIALFRYGDRKGGADVIFGQRGDSTLLGATTLESLGLSLDPIKRRLKPLRLVLA